MTDGTLFSGKTVEEAVADGLRSLGLKQDQVDVEVVSRGSRGLFGIGSEPAQVRITPRPLKNVARPADAAPAAEAQSATAAAKPAATERVEQADKQERREVRTTPVTAPPQAEKSQEPPTTPGSESHAKANKMERAAPVDDTAGDEADAETDAIDDVGDDELAALGIELLSETVRLMGFDADVVASWQEPDADNDDRYLLLNLHGRDLGALIGRRGETLGNLQYLLRLMVNQRLHQWKNIVVDVEQYRQHRAEHLTQLALRSAEQVADSGRPLSLEPMPSNERRIIHLTLRDHASVYTESIGEGERRKIQILPRRS